MTPFSVYEKSTGRVIMTGFCNQQDAESYASETAGVLLVPSDYRSQYVNAGELVQIPPQPTEFHDWNWASKAWEPNIERARAKRRAAVDVRRTALANGPILYAGVNLDADKAAQDNVTSKLGEIADSEAIGEALPVELLFWRDFDNQMHTFPDQAAYKAWLQGLRIAMGRRGTALYVWAWGKKTEIDAAISPEEILAIDLTGPN